MAVRKRDNRPALLYVKYAARQACLQLSLGGDGRGHRCHSSWRLIEAIEAFKAACYTGVILA